MSKKTRIEPSSGNGNRSDLRSHQTPLRRSLRFLPQKIDQLFTTELPNSQKKPKKPPSCETHLQSSPVSPDSGKFSVFSWKSKRTPLRSIGNLQGFNEKSQKKLPSGTLRRSPRLVSSSDEVSKNSTDAVQNRRRSLRLAANSSGSLKKGSLLEGNLGLGEMKDRQWKPIRSTSNVKFNNGKGSSEKERRDGDCLMIPQINQRRSPRFAAILGEITGEEVALDAKVNNEKGSREKEIRDGDCLMIPQINQRRSPRFATILGETTREGVALDAKVNNEKGSSEKEIRNGDCLMIPQINQRRSPRFTTILGEITREGVALDATLEGSKMKERKASDKMKAVINELDVKENSPQMERGLRNRSAVPKVREGGGNKRRKIEKSDGENVGIEKVEKEKSIGLEGWMKEQEEALQRAYMAANPSPHFWKKVSKMVPGKSAQECFDRIHAGFPTPPEPQPRSRRKPPTVSPIGNFSLSGSKSIKPTMRRASRVRKSLAAQKTARHLLRKHCSVDQSREADHFSVLETSPNALAINFPDITSPQTPDCVPSPDSLQKCSGSLSSAHQKRLSRFKTSTKEIQPSPEVLKRVKNVALHEKYIDQLHHREKSRMFGKAATTVATIDGKNQEKKKTSVVKTARIALQSEASDFISHFQFMQANSHGILDNDDAGGDEDACCNNDDENCDGDE